MRNGLNNACAPSKAELIDAITKAKADGLTSTEIKYTDRGAQKVRFHLGKRWDDFPLDDIRISCTSLSKAGGEPGRRKVSPERKREAVFDRFLKAYPPTFKHSAEYDAIHQSERFKQLKRDLKEATDYRCQFCVRSFGGHPELLEGHILDYERWDMPGMMLLLCTHCHPIADALRRWGMEHDRYDHLELIG